MTSSVNAYIILWCLDQEFRRLGLMNMKLSLRKKDGVNRISRTEREEIEKNKMKIQYVCMFRRWVIYYVSKRGRAGFNGRPCFESHSTTLF